ncbi:MAG: hypothetical protein AB7T48_08195 [Solirubrobacterales bacterium]
MSPSGVSLRKLLGLNPAPEAVAGERAAEAAARSERIAWEYLLPEFPMTRRIDTVKIFSPRRGVRLMTLDVSIPDARWDLGIVPRSQYLLPAAFLSKKPPVHDLTVSDGGGATIPVPTRRENMAITIEALARIEGRAARTLGQPDDRYRLDDRLRALVGDVITMPPLEARVCALEVAAQVEGTEIASWLLPLVNKLEDHFLLWVPVQGRAGSEHRIVVSHSTVREPPHSIFPRIKGKPKAFEVECSHEDEMIKADLRPVKRWVRGFDPAAVVGRLLVTFSLMPVKFAQETLEADRFRSYHLCVEPPPGLILREVRAGEMTKVAWDPERYDVDEFDQEESERVLVQGEDSRAGHIRLATDGNPPRVYSRVMIGMKPGTTTLWALVAVLTCLLLGAFHHSIKDLTPAEGRFECLVTAAKRTNPNCDRYYGLAEATAAPREEPPEKPGRNRINLTIAVAVLLIGPTFASVWTLREGDRTLMRSMLSGTRLLLLGSALLSVATALALAGVTPFGWGKGVAVGWYASLSYTIAMVFVVGWLQAQAPVWFLYRRVLTRTRWNLVATFCLALIAAGALWKISSFPPYCLAILLLAGFGFTAVAGNRRPTRLNEVVRLPPLLAGVGGIVTLALASREFYFYNHVKDLGETHWIGLRVELALAAATMVVAVIRHYYLAYEYAKIAEFEAAHKGTRGLSSKNSLVSS